MKCMHFGKLMCPNFHFENENHNQCVFTNGYANACKIHTPTPSIEFVEKQELGEKKCQLFLSVCALFILPFFCLPN